MKNKFKLKKNQSKELKAARKKAKKLYKDKANRLKMLNEQERKVYEMLSDPDNEFMNQIKYGSDDDL